MSLDSLLLLAAASPTAAAEVAKPDYLTLLFVFMLATFTGLLVIRNVSRLLHTPLMSLTNAISAIAVVGSIVLAGKQETDVHHDSRHDRRGRLDDQHRQRLPADRSDAQDVQEAGAQQVMNMDTVIQLIYLVSAILFILSLMWMSHPEHGPARRVRRRGRHAGGHRRHAAAAGNLELHLDRHRHGRSAA